MFDDPVDAVRRDGLPRQGVALDGSAQVYYLDGDQVRSTPAADWPPPLPSDPTPQQIAAALAARLAAAQQAQADALALRSTILATARTAEGVLLANLTTNQIKALLAILLWKEGGVKADMTVKPLSEWVK